MSKNLEVKRKLAQYLLEKTKLDKTRKLDTYTPLSYQERFHRSDKKIRLFVGTNRCGKTTAGVIEAIWMATGRHPYRPVTIPNKGRVIGVDYPNAIAGTLFPKFQEWINPADLLGGEWSQQSFRRNQQGMPHQIHFANGSIIQFMSSDQETTKFESFDTDWIMFDEPPQEDVYIAATRGLVDRGGIHWFVLTPLNCSWLYERLYEPLQNGTRTDGAIFNGNTIENPFVDQEAWREYIHNLPEAEYKARACGQFSHLIGTIFKDFDASIHVVDPTKLDRYKNGWPQSWPVIEAIDPHVTGNKPHCVIWLGVSPEDDIFVIDYLQYNGTIQGLGEAIKEKRKNKHIIQSMCDNSLNTDVDRQNQYNLLCLTGVRPRLLQKKPLVQAGINYISYLLKAKKFFIFNYCVPVIREFKLYMWNETREGEPVKKNDDFIDGIRYALECNHTFTNDIQPISMVNNFEPYGGTH